MGYARAARVILAGKHPVALDRPFLEVWSEIRDDLVPIVERAFAGEPVHMGDIAFIMERRGYLEETHCAFAYTPVRDPAGRRRRIRLRVSSTYGKVKVNRTEFAGGCLA